MDPAELTPLPGGHSGETFLAEAAGERSVVRVYASRSLHRGPGAAAIDAAVLRLVRGLLPVPEVREVRQGRPHLDEPAVLVTSLLPGVRLDLLLPRLDDGGLARVGQQVGRVLARLVQMPMPRAGFFVDDRLTLEPWIPDLPGYVEQARTETALAAWSRSDVEGLLVVAEEAQARLDEVRRTCLVHSDLNPKNLLVDPATLAVTGLVDWEFAHAGWPVTDLGNLLRFDRRPAFVGAVLATYGERVVDAGAHGGVPVLDLARSADLFALVELAGRRGTNPVADRAHALLLAVARQRSVHAEPG